MKIINKTLRLSLFLRRSMGTRDNEERGENIG